MYDFCNGYGIGWSKTQFNIAKDEHSKCRHIKVPHNASVSSYLSLLAINSIYVVVSVGMVLRRRSPAWDV